MRVIAGEFRGMKLFVPKGDDIRPTTDRAREDIFNILSPYIAGCTFLDLFAGTGAAGIEAVSRGAAKSVFVDNSQKSIELIRQNIQKTKRSENFEFFKSDALKYLHETIHSYDIIFLDPPYNFRDCEKIISLICSRNLLNRGGAVAAEQGREPQLPETIGNLSLFRKKLYSSSAVYFYKENSIENSFLSGEL